MISDADDSSPPKLVGRTQRILLELSTIFYFFARNAAIPLVQQYVYHLVARKYNLTESEAAAAADADEGLRPVTNSSIGEKLVPEDQLQTATDGRLVCRTVQLVPISMTLNDLVRRNSLFCVVHRIRLLC